MDVALEFKILFFIGQKIKVSILVLVDVALELLMALTARLVLFYVSILVLVDVALELQCSRN